jgi:myo-inositol-1(or 4)-monophosphatase
MGIENLNSICSQALEVVNGAALFIRSNLDQVSQEQVIEKGKNSLVSYVDQQSEKIIVDGLKKILPEAGFITEEEMTDQGQKSLTWIIDPLDGTTNFLHSVPFFSVSVALYDGQNIIIGIVHEVVHDEVFCAIIGQGATKNNVAIKVTDRPDFHDVLVGTGFPYKTEHTVQGHFDALKEVLIRTRGIRRFGSAALDLCYVACGRLGAFYENTLNAYDIAAGALIVKEAGGKVTDFRGSDYWLFEGEILATAPQYELNMLSITAHFGSKS